MDFSLCENKDTDQRCSNCTAYQHLCFHYMDVQYQHLCFHYMDSTNPLHFIFKISNLYPSSVLVQLGLCQTDQKPHYWFSQYTAKSNTQKILANAVVERPCWEFISRGFLVFLQCKVLDAMKEVVWWQHCATYIFCCKVCCMHV